MKSPPLFVRFFCLIAALTVLPGVARAAQYSGTFTQTITGSNIPGVSVGAKYYASYTYESETMDGVFSSGWGLYPLHDYPLTGFIFMPFATEAETIWGTLDYGWGAMWRTLESTVNSGTLTVTNGQVTDFQWTWEEGGFYMYADLGGFFTWNFYDRQGLIDPPGAGGSFSFSGPYEVPDSASSFWMLALCFLGLRLVRRKVAA